MHRRHLLATVAAGTLGGLAGCASGGLGGDEGEPATPTDGDSNAESDWPTGAYAGYDTTLVTAQTADGDRLGAVTAAIAQTRKQRYLGLSDAESLPEDAGMLFVFPEPRDRLTFVMRGMSFGIDIVYADAEGRIVEVHNAPKPGPNEDGNEQRYPGSGQYVLEVPYKWTDRNDVAVGNSLAFDL